MVCLEVKTGANITIVPVFDLNTQQIDERVVDKSF
jgi:hypothetical protein